MSALARRVQVYIATDDEDALWKLVLDLNMAVFAQYNATRVFAMHHYLTEQCSSLQPGYEILADMQLLSIGDRLVGNCLSGVSAVPAAMMHADAVTYGHGAAPRRAQLAPITVRPKCDRIDLWPQMQWIVKTAN